MKYVTRLDEDVRSVLIASVITKDSLTLPSGQLERSLYDRVNKVLVSAGGKWHKGRRAHIFADDPSGVLGLALETGAIVDERKASQQFFTPDALAHRIAQTAKIGDDMIVLEPSAGDGSLARAASLRGGNVVCVERDARLAQRLLADGFVTLLADFLTVSLSHTFLKADRVVMNPPFADGQDIAHVTHAFGFLNYGGRLVAVMGSGVKTNQSKAAIAFRRLVDANGGEFQNLPDDSFVESGTSVRTVLLTMLAVKS
jgi:predicted RNA methylase